MDSRWLIFPVRTAVQLNGRVERVAYRAVTYVERGPAVNGSGRLRPASTVARNPVGRGCCTKTTQWPTIRPSDYFTDSRIFNRQASMELIYVNENKKKA